jgi:hypothetical protein
LPGVENKCGNLKIECTNIPAVTKVPTVIMTINRRSMHRNNPAFKEVV